MHERIIVAGFGGQGVIMAGKLLCIAAMNENKYVSHIPSYGAEMRGGTANCSVVISSKEIGSPTVPKKPMIYQKLKAAPGLQIWLPSVS